MSAEPLAGGAGDWPDLDAIATDLADVETALAQLADGTYATDGRTADRRPPTP